MIQDKQKLIEGFADPRSLIPKSVKPLFDTWIRDTHISLCADGYYYLTGTTRSKGEENAFNFNDGIRLWRSPDLKIWDDLGLVWSFEKDGTWQNKFMRQFGDGKVFDNGFRAIYAPEIYSINEDFYITASINWPPQIEGEEGSYTFLLKSATKRAEGPYVDACGGPLTRRIDSSLFVDDDGEVYYVWQDGRIARMKKDMTGFAEQPRNVIQERFSPEPYCEGVFVFKENGKYHMALAIWAMEIDGKVGYFPGKKENKLSYDCVIASADNIYGPYGKRYTAITGGGHNSFFRDRSGKLYATLFGNPVNDSYAPFYAKPAIVEIGCADGKFFPKENLVQEETK